MDVVRIRKEISVIAKIYVLLVIIFDGVQICDRKLQILRSFFALEKIKNKKLFIA